MYKSPYKSPSRRSFTSSTPQSLSISSYSNNTSNKSPFNRDRFVGSNKSPSRQSLMKENMPPDMDYNYGKKLMDTPTKHRTAKPVINDKILDAPDVLGEFPCKILDINQKNEIAVALGSSVYVWEEGQANELMHGCTAINAVCWVGDYVALSGSGYVELWDVSRMCAVKTLNGHDKRAAALAYGNGLFATGGADGIVNVYDLRADTVQPYHAHKGEVCSLSWSLDGRSLASCASDNSIAILGSRNVKLHSSSRVQALSWMHSGVLLTGDENGVIKLIHTRSEDEDMRVATGSPITGMCFTEQWGILTGHMNGTWSIYQPDLHKVAEYEGHHQAVLSIAANTEGSLVATISADESLRICELSMPINNSPVHSPRYGMSPFNSPRYGMSSCNSPRFSHTPTNSPTNRTTPNRVQYFQSSRGTLMPR
ncbi:cell division cycle 20.1, cofactor of APC complex-like [Histomonas meleagridis]|uniref:cell division cycle 20.1, cofactor of APC complex-like n=1 Tax=Histomonas meleagridis TaxID=135588 RepID=UPI00355AA926|nr:cell division cycle 20.1, cofactor of APC complex-like [Histomonas meleagridis]KAH0806979.1 cell division cycle 20.1, cofactor of APC complex-like [Histomonas meleagridis]